MTRSLRSTVAARLRATAFVALMMTAAACSSGSGSTALPSAPSSSSTSAAHAGNRALLYDGLPIFGTASFWNADVRSAPVNPDSDAIVAELARQVATTNGGIASFNVWQYNAAIVSVPGSQKRVDVAFDNCQHKSYTPRGLTGAGGQFVGVPIPDGVTTNVGTDSELSIVSPTTHELWEFWRLKKDGVAWKACWGGHIDDTRTSAGYFLGGFGATASGLATAAGAVHLADVRAGRIDHALILAIPSTAPWKTFSWPAQRSDGSSRSKSPIRTGTRFRLPASIDVESLRLTPIGAMVAHAAQDYGLVVSDKSRTVSVIAESGAEEQAVTGTNPWTHLLGGAKSYSVLHGFPWDRLQALPSGYGRPGSTS